VGKVIIINTDLIFDIINYIILKNTHVSLKLLQYFPKKKLHNRRRTWEGPLRLKAPDDKVNDGRKYRIKGFD